jgi:phosphoribosylformylglycinamidine synthase II
LMVLNPENEDVAKAIFDKWDLDFAIVGHTIAEDRFVIMHNNELKADLPLKALSGTAPEYDRPWVETPAQAPLAEVAAVNPAQALLSIMGAPNYASRAWVYEQYDHMVMADTVIRPGSDAGVVRVHATGKALAFTSDVTPRYCKANPFEGGKQAVAEAYRNLIPTGARPLATTDNLNFGNPEKPEIMGQFVGCIKGIGAAVAALDMPIVSGNVSLYNETDGVAILPTPTIGAVGLLDSLDQLITMIPAAGDTLVLIGHGVGHMGQSAYLAEVLGRCDGEAPPVDLLAERKAGDLILAAKAKGLVSAAHDLSDGGLAVAAAEMALAGHLGVTLQAGDTGWFFGEDQGRYLVATERAEDLIALAGTYGVQAQAVGTFGGDVVRLGGSEISLDGLRDAHETGLSKIVS